MCIAISKSPCELSEGIYSGFPVSAVDRCEISKLESQSILGKMIGAQLLEILG